MKNFRPVSFFAGAVFALTIISASAFCGDSSTRIYPPSYVVNKTATPIVIDGKIGEDEWGKAPMMEYRGLQDGSAPPFRCYGKMLWDDEYFYIAVYNEDPDVWASLKKETPEPDSWFGHENEFIFMNDCFAKIFFDPDGDGHDYVEVHINPAGKVDDIYLVDSWHVAGFDKKFFDSKNYHPDWNCVGLKTAVFVNGTLDNPKDVDKGWSVEAAFPWKSLKSVTKGNCPPAPGDVWRAHTGWVYENAPRSEHMYYTWPVIGKIDCHILPRWGYIVFAKQYDEIKWPKDFLEKDK